MIFISYAYASFDNDNTYELVCSNVDNRPKETSVFSVSPGVGFELQLQTWVRKHVQQKLGKCKIQWVN